MNSNPDTTAFLFPGQGSQSVGMGRELARSYPVANQVFVQADSILDSHFSKIMWEGPEDVLNDTINTQPALFIHSLAAYRVINEIYPAFKPATLAGHSLGELSALTVAGALTFDTGLRLVRKRGELMKRAGDLAPGGMAAILGLDIPTLEDVCRQASAPDEIVQVANDNCPGQVVISGAKAAVERAVIGAKSAGAKRAVPLAISIAAHSPLMSSIQSDWNLAVDDAGLVDPKIRVMGNVQASFLISAAAARQDLQAQMQSRVRWTESIQNLITAGTQTFIEVGNGSVLIGLLKRISNSKELVGLPMGDPDHFQALNLTT